MEGPQGRVATSLSLPKGERPCSAQVSTSASPHLDLALASGTAKPTRLRFPNTPEGRQALLAALAHLRPHLGGPGAHGRLPPPLLKLLAEKGLQVALVNPYHLAAFRRAAGSATRPTAKTPSSSPTTPGSTGKASGPTPYPRKPSGSSGPWWATGRIWPGGAGHPQPDGGGGMGGERGGPRPPPEGAGLREGAPLGRWRPGIQALLATLPEAGGPHGPARGGAPGGGGGAGPPAPRALGPGEGRGLLRGAHSRAGGVGEERGEESALQERASLLRRKLYMGALVAVRHDRRCGPSTTAYSRGPGSAQLRRSVIQEVA